MSNKSKKIRLYEDVSLLLQLLDASLDLGLPRVLCGWITEHLTPSLLAKPFRNCLRMLTWHVLKAHGQKHRPASSWARHAGQSPAQMFKIYPKSPPKGVLEVK